MECHSEEEVILYYTSMIGEGDRSRKQQIVVPDVET